MSGISLIHCQQAANQGSSSGHINFTGTSLQSLITSIINNGVNATFTSGSKHAFVDFLNRICEVETCNFIPQGWSYPLVQCLGISFSGADGNYYDSELEGKLLKIYVETVYASTGVAIFYFEGVLPPRNNQSQLYIPSSVCIFDKYNAKVTTDCGRFNPYSYSNFTASAIPLGGQTNNIFELSSPLPPEPECDDLRTSVPPHTMRFTITNGILSVTKDLDCYCTAMDNVFPFDSTVFTGQEIRDIFTMFMGYMANPIRCACRFISGVVRSNCSVKLNVEVTGYKCYCQEIGGIFGIGYEDLTPTIKQLFDATFVECLDKPVSYTENLSHYCEGLVNSGDGWCMFFNPLNITVSNLECETDVCCDDVSDDEIDEIETPQIDTLGGFTSGGGGSDVDLTCICDGLASLNQMLATKLDNLVDGQAVIADAISDIQIDVSSEDLVEAVEGVSTAIGAIDNSCICEELEEIDTTLQGLDLSVSNTVTPCQPIVTNPVNNITVTPSTAQITVEPCSPTINVEPTSVSVDLTGIESSLESLNDSMLDLSSNLSSVGDGLSCNDKGLACILEDALNVSKIEDGESVTKSITEVIDSKSQDVTVETIVEPCDYTYTRRASLDDIG